MVKNKPNITTLKYIATGYFMLIAALSLAETLWNSKAFAWRDIVLLAIASLPLLVNKRLFYLGYGILISLITLTILIAYIAMHNYSQPDDSLAYFLLGCLVHALSLSCALTLIYVGTYSAEKNRFLLF
ncbi:hypothetical protein [Flavobacterium phycosphaerae]|uniref:hypothetical protein n=1 Tax=Flavobacterium phycosphaerae TaxID=2697515 RepID=UPI00138958BE|nr:hypothetical protein [Flavobacterium phycosphaerae]